MPAFPWARCDLVPDEKGPPRRPGGPRQREGPQKPYYCFFTDFVVPFANHICSTVHRMATNPPKLRSAAESTAARLARRWHRDTMEHTTFLHRPTLRRPFLIAAFEGWNDAGEAASTALGFVGAALDADRAARRRDAPQDRVAGGGAPGRAPAHRRPRPRPAPRARAQPALARLRPRGAGGRHQHARRDGGDLGSAARRRAAHQARAGRRLGRRPEAGGPLRPAAVALRGADRDPRGAVGRGQPRLGARPEPVGGAAPLRAGGTQPEGRARPGGEARRAAAATARHLHPGRCDQGVRRDRGRADRRRPRPATASVRLRVLLRDLAHVGGLQALGAFQDLELDHLALVQGPEPVHLDRGEMYEYVLTVRTGDEAVALVRVEPLYDAGGHLPVPPSNRLLARNFNHQLTPINSVN